MVQPVTGPFIVERNLPGSYMYRDWCRQGKPHTVRLPYASVRKQVTSSNEPSLGSAAGLGIDASDRARTLARNQAYESFKSRVSDPASLAVSLAEHKQATDMISKRVTSLTELSKAVRREDWAKANDVLGVPRGRKPKIRRESKAFGNRWLEFHFGWVPLVSDIGQAIEVLQRPFLKPSTVKGRGSSNSRTSYGNPRDFYFHQTAATVRCQIIAEVEVTNQSLWLANQLGFVNPASVLWETVPFSFLVDWFVNVGDVLASMTDFVGLGISNPATTYYTTGSGLEIYTFSDTEIQYKSWSGRSMYRTLGLTGPSLAFKPVKALSVTRGLTAVSLLLQTLK